MCTPETVVAPEGETEVDNGAGAPAAGVFGTALVAEGEDAGRLRKDSADVAFGWAMLKETTTRWDCALWM